MDLQTQSDILNAYTVVKAASQLIERELIQLHPRPAMLERWRELRGDAEGRIVELVRSCAMANVA